MLRVVSNRMAVLIEFGGREIPRRFDAAVWRLILEGDDVDFF